MPKDRPIDGVDASAFMLGKSNTTGRDSYMFFGADGELMSIKWKIYKTIFRYTEAPVSIEKPYIKPQFPMIYDLSSDPHEDNNLVLLGFHHWLDIWLRISRSSANTTQHKQIPQHQSR